MPDHPPDGLIHSPGRLLSVPLVPREELSWGRGRRSVTRPPVPPTPPPISLWPLTWPPGPPRLFSSSRNCILRTTRGSVRGGYGRPVTITPRPFMSAKSRPSLAWGVVGTLPPSAHARSLRGTGTHKWAGRAKPPTLGQALRGIHSPQGLSQSRDPLPTFPPAAREGHSLPMPRATAWGLPSKGRDGYTVLTHACWT